MTLLHQQIEEAAPGHAQEVRRSFIDRLTPEELDQFLFFVLEAS